MFFRRRTARPATFEERLGTLRQSGFETRPDGTARARVERGGCYAVIGQEGSAAPRILESGLIAGSETAVLVDGGYQKFFESAGGRRRPALAEDLKNLHAFLEDLREALGLVSLYNESLGTTFSRHDYDRLRGRE